MKRYTPLLVLLFALTFYSILSAKEWTWLFVSSDSGDWLAASQMWMVPQPMGSPLYILLGRLLSVLPGELPVIMTLTLSCLASAVTVMMTYLIVKRLTASELIAAVCSILLLSSAVFLTQSTVLEEYVLTAMFMTVAFWYYITDHKKLTGLFLGLAIAVHSFALVLSLLWAIILWREWKKWIKPGLITLSITIAFYVLIPILMYFDTPRLLAGNLSVSSLKTYIFDITGGIVGTMSVFEAPKRFLHVGMILIVSFSVGLIPAVKTVKPISSMKLMLISNVAFILWYVLTTIDPITWTYITFIAPSIVILCGLGLQSYKRQFVYAVLTVALVLTGLNAFYLNAGRLTQSHFLADRYYNELMSLPEGSIVVTTPGAYSLGMFYVMSEGKDLVPLIYPYIDEWKFWDYYDWLRVTYPDMIPGSDTLSIVRANLGKIPIFYAQRPYSLNNIEPYLVLGGDETSLVRVIEGVK